MTLFYDALAQVQDEYAKLENALASAINQTEEAWARVAALEAELAACQNPAWVALGCSARFFGEFQSALGQPLAVSRIFAGMGTTGWDTAQSLTSVRPLVDFRRKDGEDDVLFRMRLEGIATRDFAIRPLVTFTAEAERPEKNITREDFIRLHKMTYEVLSPVADIGWCLMAASFRNGQAEQFYPGDEFVDMVCCDGYAKANPYPTPGWIFDATSAFATLHSKSLGILEFGTKTNLSGTTPAMREEWIEDFHSWVPTTPTEIACYWESSTATDFYEIRQEPGPMAAFARMAADPYFGA